METPKEHADIIIAQQRSILRTLARLKALESVIFDRMPPSEREAAWKAVGEQANRILQVLLEDAEKKSPWFAASLDDRGPEELTGLDEPLK